MQKDSTLKRNIIYLWIYLVLALMHIIGEWMANKAIIFATKPLLMPVLGIWFWTSTTKLAGNIRWGILLALLFATFGDTFLMFEAYAPVGFSLFVPGLGSFLLTHLLYIFVFGKIAQGDWSYLYRRPLVLGLLATFLFAILYYLWPDLPAGLNVAVVIYSTCIVAMTAVAINTRPQLLPQAYLILLIGVFSFLFSDTVIALNKFKSDQLSIPYVRLIIMFFYLLGQGLIVGSLVANKSAKPRT